MDLSRHRTSRGRSKRRTSHYACLHLALLIVSASCDRIEYFCAPFSTQDSAANSSSHSRIELASVSTTSQMAHLRHLSNPYCKTIADISFALSMVLVQTSHQPQTYWWSCTRATCRETWSLSLECAQNWLFHVISANTTWVLKRILYHYPPT